MSAPPVELRVTMLFALGSKKPTLSQRYFIAPNAALIGDVLIGEDVSIWFNAVIRGDNDTISIGSGSNVQDGAVLHVDEGVPLSIGERVTIGHKVMLHGCTIGDGSLIGMNAVVLNHAVVGRNCLIGANSLLTEGMQVPDGSLVVGSPARILKPVSAAALDIMEAGTQNYIDKIAYYRDNLNMIDQEAVRK